MTKQEDFVKKYFEPALQSCGNLSVYFVLAQTALESGWGEKAIGYNLGGITAGKSWKGMKQKVLTTEYSDSNTKFQDCKIQSITPYFSEKHQKTRYKYMVWRWFRDYPNAKAFFEDHFKILSLDRYKPAFDFKDDIYQFTYMIVDLGYATGDATKYAKTVTSIAKSIKTIASKQFNILPEVIIRP